MSEEQVEDMVRLSWSGNHSHKYDGRIENVPMHCVLEEDLPLQVGKSVRIPLDCGGGEQVWSGMVVEKKRLPSVLQLALPEKRAAYRDQVLILLYGVTL